MGAGAAANNLWESIPAKLKSGSKATVIRSEV